MAAGTSRVTVALGAVGLFGVVTLGMIACESASKPAIQTGPWRAWLDSPGGELPFGLVLEGEASDLKAVIVNGEERIEVPEVSWSDGRLLLELNHYDATLTARVSQAGRRLDGEWLKTLGVDKLSRLPFHAAAGAAPRFEPAAASAGADPVAVEETVAGRWLVHFDSSDEPAVAEFRVDESGSASGTFLTSTGDYRFLAGSYAAGRLRLSCFDGAHAFLFHAQLDSDGLLAGDFWSRDVWHERWTARRDAASELADPFALTRWVEGSQLGDLAFRDLDGRTRSLDDPEYAGRARLIELFGSWCPNCGDAARYLSELDRRYRDRGLSIVGLAFELTPDHERSVRQLRRYAERHAVAFPLLIAGLADKQLASEAFPLVDRVHAYPTVIFMSADGQVRAIHTGFSGPATGSAYAAQALRYEALIEELLMAGEGG